MPEQFSIDYGMRRKVFTVPSACPICQNRAVQQPFHRNLKRYKDELEAVFLCPNVDCQSLFIAYYQLKDEPESQPIEPVRPPGQGVLEMEAEDIFLPSSLLEYAPIAIEPMQVPQQPFPDFVEQVSPNFLSIYQEAFEAKERGLLQVAGPGFRKAFEFLIREYLVRGKTEPEKARIENNAIAQVIGDFVPNGNLKEMAVRAFWLGNDETHYKRHWVGRDINDQLVLIRLSILWMEQEYLTTQYQSDMPRPSR